MTRPPTTSNVSASVPVSARTQTRSSGGDERSDGRAGPGFWVAMAGGAALVAFGARTLWLDQRRHLANIGRWFVGGALAVDLLIVPVGAALATGVRRACPPWAWPVVRAGLLAAATCLLIGLPLALDEGGNPANPSVRPRAYGWGLAGTLLAIAVVTIAVAAGTARRRAR